MAQEEVFVPFPAGRDRVLPLRAVRSGLLCSSMKSLRERGLFERYLAALRPEHRATMLSMTASAWVPPEVALVHYDACEALGLSAEAQTEIGRDVGQHLQRGYLSVAVRMANQGGVNPWTILGLYPKLWSRYYQGSAVGVFKLGPKDARAEFVGWPMARIPYVQQGMVGILGGLVELFCTRMYVRRDRALCTQTTLGYRLSWA